MPSRTIRTLLALAVLLAALPALAGEIYQWKDANGVSHYSDSPPPDRKGVQSRPLKGGPAAPAETGKPTEDPNCVIARRNLVQLKDDRPVGQDANGDGKPDTFMTAEERAQQVRKTEQMLKEFCDKAAQA